MQSTSGGGLRVCYVLKRFPRLSQTFVLTELLELERQGVEVVVIARDDSGEELGHEATMLLRAPVHYLRELDADPGRWDAAAAELVRELEVSHLHAHFATWAAGAAMRVGALAGIPYSFTAHATDIYRQGLDLAALVDRMSRARFVVTVSEANRRYLEQLLADARREGRIVRLYNGLDLERVRPAGVPRRPGLVVSVGRLIEKKGFPDLIEACRLLIERGCPVQCVIVGDGPDRDRLLDQVRRSGLEGRVELAGALPQREALALIESATAFALPCVVGRDGDRDGLPTVLLEAMALLTPAVSTTVSGVPEMLEDGVSGLLVAEHDPEALADALGRLLEAPDLRARLAGQALATMRTRFDVRRNVADLRQRFAEASIPA